VEINSNHVAMVSHLDIVTDLIIRASGSVTEKMLSDFRSLKPVQCFFRNGTTSEVWAAQNDLISKKLVALYGPRKMVTITNLYSLISNQNRSSSWI